MKCSVYAGHKNYKCEICDNHFGNSQLKTMWILSQLQYEHSHQMDSWNISFFHPLIKFNKIINNPNLAQVFFCVEKIESGPDKTSDYIIIIFSNC